MSCEAGVENRKDKKSRCSVWDSPMQRSCTGLIERLCKFRTHGIAQKPAFAGQPEMIIPDFHQRRLVLQ